MSTIDFEAKLINIGSLTIARLPESASAKLPSRGIVMIDGTINGFHIYTVLEPDGKGSHWFTVNTTMLEAAKAAVGDMVSLTMESTKK